MPETGSATMKVEMLSETSAQITRVFRVPRDLLFRAMSAPEHIEQWWGPRRYRTRVVEMNFRVGGTWRFLNIGDDGEEHPFRGEYREIDPPRRVVQTFVYDVPPFNELESVEEMTLDEHDGVTTLTVIATYPSVEAAKGIIDSGMEEGAAETYDRLEEYAATLA